MARSPSVHQHLRARCSRAYGPYVILCVAPHGFGIIRSSTLQHAPLKQAVVDTNLDVIAAFCCRVSGQPLTITLPQAMLRLIDSLQRDSWSQRELKTELTLIRKAALQDLWRLVDDDMAEAAFDARGRGWMQVPLTASARWQYPSERSRYSQR